MHTIITLFGKIPISTFSLVLALGAGLGLFWSVWPVSALPLTVRARLDAGSNGLLGTLVGGRVGYIMVNWGYYQDHVVEIPQVWLGGFCWVGALAGALLAIFIWTQIQKTSFGVASDGLLPLFTSVAISAWLASWLVGYAYGVQVDAWWAVPARDELGYSAFRWPTQLVGALSALGIHWVVDYLRARKRLRIPGMATSLQTSGISLSIFVLSPYRADPALLLRGIRIDVWASTSFFILSILMALFCYLGAQFLKHKESKHERV